MATSNRSIQIQISAKRKGILRLSTFICNAVTVEGSEITVYTGKRVIAIKRVKLVHAFPVPEEPSTIEFIRWVLNEDGIQ